MNPNYDKLVRLLGELFQYDRADLDFGIYRIMNQKREEISRFLDRDLLPQVRSALEVYQPANRAELKAQLDTMVANLNAAGVDPGGAPKVRELRAQYDAAVDLTVLENQVFSDLYNFFRRYYSDGDFLSLRRYKEGVYAIPYEGEEVKLHWANADQYYIKSSENFRDYAFRLPDGRRVHFKLIDADTERDNTKAQAGKERRFILSGEPPADESGELMVRFEYRPDSEKQKTLNEKAAAAVLTLAPDEWRMALATPAPTDGNPKRTLLEKHLSDYTARNSFDYFIHKDLGGFLRRELDFFIKNEVMHLDDIEHESAPRVEQFLSRVKVLRAIARKIIAFLEQLENFQKKLWLKKKFVVETGWCVTLDRVPEELYEEIAKNDAQRAEWVSLFAIDAIEGDTVTMPYSDPMTVEFLKTNQFLVLDTKYFSPEFTERLLASFDDIEEACDGVLVHGENFQALNLLMERYREQVKCIYIDPPYNTGGDDFVYKDNYQHSSWLAMVFDRLTQAQGMLEPTGALFLSIDENEHTNASNVLNAVFGESNRVGDVIWKNSSKNDQSFVSIQHEYIIGVVKDKTASEGAWRERKEGVEEILAAFESFRKKWGNNWHAIHREALKWYKQFPDSNSIADSKHYSWMDEHGVYFPADISGPNFGQYIYNVVHPVTRKYCKAPASGWRYPEETMSIRIRENLIHFGPDETTVPNNKTYLQDTQYQSFTSVKYRDGRVGSNLLKNILGGKLFQNPKDVDVTARLIRATGSFGVVICDFFAGSGTTAHAVISLNREDGGRRKYLLVEMGEYFDTVLKPRVQKVVYSRDWKDGKPVSRQGSSHMFKYIRLESYEDTLNNLELSRTSAQTSLLEKHDHMREDYTLHYMLDVESQGSLLSAERFSDPFNCMLKVATGSVGETRLATVDLVETFNYLIGLRVRQRETVRGFRVLRGTTATDERTLIIWRNTHEKTSAELDEFFTKQAYNTRDLEFDVIYVNGDNNLENLRRDDETWKVRLIEEEFGRRMFEEAR